jgi:hypothetical protein
LITGLSAKKPSSYPVTQSLESRANNTEIPLTPFPIAPTKQDLYTNLDETPITSQCTYARRATTVAEVTLAGFDLATISLPEAPNREYRDDLKIYTAAARISAVEDIKCLDHLHRHISSPSHTSILINTLYPIYQLLPIGKLSFMLHWKRIN